MPDWRPIAEAQHIPYDTIADLRFAGGHVHRATWCYRGHVCAWWADEHPDRRVGLYEPKAFRIVDVNELAA